MSARTFDNSKTIEQVQAELDAGPPSERADLVETVRELLHANNDPPTPEDESVFRRFIDGEISADEFAGQYGARV